MRSLRTAPLQLLLLLILLICAAPGASDSADANVTENPRSQRDSEAEGLASPRVWLASCLAIFVISLVGLAAVALVPLVQSAYYNHFIQYLVALAVGSLTGDAMLHLLPHAIVKSAMEGAQSQRWHNERQTVLKGLAALAGVYCFFMAEKVVVLVTDYRAERDALLVEQQLQHQQRIERPSGFSADGSTTLERQQQRRRVSRMYGEKSCDDIITTGLSSKALRSIDNFRSLLELQTGQPQPQPQPRSNGGGPGPQAGDSEAAEEAEAMMAEEMEEEEAEDAPASTVVELGHIHDHSDGHDHGHGHGHAHGPMASAAWMVILGDGLHNFADGLAIGAAFAQGVAGGASTSLAVLCHELPHELGDFAVLLKTGMSVRRALLYNALSSVLAAVGMVVGVCAGNATSASYWIFAVTGGIFVYISLVDMLPELNLLNVRPGESRLAHFALQNAGIATGVGVMSCIALFEDSIRSVLGDSEH